MWKGIDYLPVLASERAFAHFKAGAATCWMVSVIFTSFDEEMAKLSFTSMIAALRLALQCYSSSSLLNRNHHLHVETQRYE